MYSRYHGNVRVSYVHELLYTKHICWTAYFNSHKLREKKESYVVYDYSYGWKCYWAKHHL